MLHQIKAQQFYTDLGLLSIVLCPIENSRIQGLFKALSYFPVLFKADLIFKDFSRQSCIFKYFSSLCEPCVSYSFTDKIMYTPSIRLNLPRNSKIG